MVDKTDKMSRRIVNAEALLKEADEANRALAEQSFVDPFEGDSVSVEVTKQINVQQFQDELSRQIGRQVHVSLVVGEDMDRIASKEHPAILIASPRTIGERALTEAVARHVANDALLPGAVPQTASQPVAVHNLSDDAKAAAAKIADGKTLTTAELTTLMASLLGVSQG